jgi:hypothetical protein
MWTSAVAMLNVPRVTMNGGSRSAATSQPLRKPAAMPISRPRPTARTGSRPDRTVSPVIITDERAMIHEQERSMPPVRMISVWPIEMVPTTMTMEDQRDWARQNLSLWVVKMTIASECRQRPDDWGLPADPARRIGDC